jgi:uncharacterized protein
MKFTTLILIATLGLVACHSNPAADRLAGMRAADLFTDAREVALVEAVGRGNVVKIGQLLDQGVDKNTRGREGVTPLIWALIKQNKAGYKYLLEQGADPNLQIEQGDSAVSFAAIHEDVDFLALALRYGGNANVVDPHTGKTPIYDSIDHRRTDSVRLLIRNGADLNFKDRTGVTPLMHAAGVIQYELAYEMLKAGADPSITNNWGNTVVWSVKTRNVDPKSEVYLWRAKVIELLEARGMQLE